MADSADTYTIALVDPDEDYVEWAQKYLAAPGVEIVAVDDAAKAVPYCLKTPPDLCIVEMVQSPVSGLDLLKQIRQNQPNALVVLTSGFPPTNAVIEAMKWGAYEFLRKEALPFDLKRVVESALQACEEMRRGVGRKDKVAGPEETIIGRSAAMQEVFKLVGRVSRGEAPVLITGESGTGKEVVAGAVHQYSLRAKKDFVAINCAAIPDNLLESELFGHEKGAFTGASTQRVGRFEQCDGGTLFLDEIGDMPMQTQGKILRVLQEGEFSRVGGNDTLRSDVRVLAATNKDLEAEVAAGTFREDLFYRLNVVRIHIPPLRERIDDVPLLADFFLRRAAGQKGAPQLRLTDGAREALCEHSWPGNVRELENTLYRASALSNTTVLLPQDIPLGSSGSSGRIEEAMVQLSVRAKADGVGLLEFLQQTAIEFAKAHSADDVAAAKLLGITTANLAKRKPTTNDTTA